MDKTFTYWSGSILNGKRQPLVFRGRAFTILSLSGATTLKVGFDGIKEESLRAGVPIEWPEDFERVSLYNDSGSTVTVEVVGAVAKIGDGGANLSSLSSLETLVAAGNALLTDIKTLSELRDTPSVISDTVVAATGSTGTQLVAASANNREVFIQNDHDSAGSVYVGYTDAVAAAACGCRLLPGDSRVFRVSCAIYATSENGTETVRGDIHAVA